MTTAAHAVRRVTVAEVQARMLRAWRPGESAFQLVVAENGAGKTGLNTRVIMPLCAHDRVLCIDVSGDDPMLAGYGAPIERLSRGLHNTGEGPGRNWYRLVVDPVNDKAGAKAAVAEALDVVLDEGHWIVFVDETRTVTDNDELALRAKLEAALLRGRKRGLQAVCAAQATEYMVPSVRNQWAVAWLGPLKDDNVIKRALQITSLPWQGAEGRAFMALLRDMPRGQWLYLDRESGRPALAIVETWRPDLV
jgi:hypothetical protein